MHHSVHDPLHVPYSSHSTTPPSKATATAAVEDTSNKSNKSSRSSRDNNNNSNESDWVSFLWSCGGIHGNEDDVTSATWNRTIVDDELDESSPTSSSNTSPPTTLVERSTATNTPSSSSSTTTTNKCTTIMIPKTNAPRRNGSSSDATVTAPPNPPSLYSGASTKTTTTTNTSISATSTDPPPRSSHHHHHAPPPPTTNHPRRVQSLLSSYSTTSISKHYALNNQILAAFDSLYAQKLYQVAYAIGMQFVEMALLEIPKHGYYYSSRHDWERMQSSYDALRVAEQLEQVLQHEAAATSAAASSSAQQQKQTQMENWKVSKLLQLAKEQEQNLEQFEQERELVEAELRSAEAAGHTFGLERFVFCAPSPSSLLDYAADVVMSSAAIICPTTTTTTSTTNIEEEPQPRYNNDNKATMVTLPPKQSVSSNNKNNNKKSNSKASTSGPSHRTSITDSDMTFPLAMIKRESYPGKSPTSFTNQRIVDSSAPPLAPTGSSITTWNKDGGHNNGDDSIRIEEDDWVTVPTAAAYPQRDDSFGGTMSHMSEPSSGHRDGAPTLVPSALQERVSTDMELERALWLSGLSHSMTEEELLLMQQHSFGTDVAVDPSLWSAPPLDKKKKMMMMTGVTTASSSSSGGTNGALLLGKKKKNKIRRKSTDIDLLSLELCYHEDFDMLRETRRVRLTRLRTHQGMLPGSINGCTVIAPLLCIHHFLNDTNNGGLSPDRGLPDELIEQVIDSETAAVLPEVRTNLGLTKDAMIIPSDVHDYLMEKNLLSQDQFVNVTGGNILETSHVDALVEALRNANGTGTPLEGKKIAATLYFHEHVVTILKLRRSFTDSWYDWIDSLPCEKNLRRRTVETEDTTTTTIDFIPLAARIRCVNEEALKATIRWYACAKFSDDNREYIDTYAWDENDTDFDPRVFQAFIWSEL